MAELSTVKHILDIYKFLVIISIADYRGRVKILCKNTNSVDDITVAAGERVAQLLLVNVSTPRVVQVDSLSGEQSERGTRGFGSSNKASNSKGSGELGKEAPETKTSGKLDKEKGKDKGKSDSESSSYNLDLQTLRKLHNPSSINRYHGCREDQKQQGGCGGGSC